MIDALKLLYVVVVIVPVTLVSLPVIAAGGALVWVIEKLGEPLK